MFIFWDIDQIFQNFEFFKHFYSPINREGFGIACIEAMASGKPIIASYINGIKDYSIQNKTGLYVKNPKNYKEFSSKILELVGNDKLCKKISNFNKLNSEKYNIMNSLNKMNSIYDNILRGLSELYEG